MPGREIEDPLKMDGDSTGLAIDFWRSMRLNGAFKQLHGRLGHICGYGIVLRESGNACALKKADHQKRCNGCQDSQKGSLRSVSVEDLVCQTQQFSLAC